MLSFVAVVAIVVGTSTAQVLVPHRCPDVTVIQDFDVARYLGLWQENERYNLIFEKGNCSTATYGPVSDEGVVKVFNREIVNGEENTIEGTARLADPSTTEGKLKVSFNVSGVATNADYWILGTDYENYSLVWSCTGLAGVASAQSAWILGRTKPLSAEAAATVQNLITANNISTEYFHTHNSEDCLTYP